MNLSSPVLLLHFLQNSGLPHSTVGFELLRHSLFVFIFNPCRQWRTLFGNQIQIPVAHPRVNKMVAHPVILLPNSLLVIPWKTGVSILSSKSQRCRLNIVLINFLVPVSSKEVPVISPEYGFTKYEVPFRLLSPSFFISKRYVRLASAGTNIAVTAPLAFSCITGATISTGMRLAVAGITLYKCGAAISVNSVLKTYAVPLKQITTTKSPLTSPAHK